jgi:exosortase
MNNVATKSMFFGLCAISLLAGWTVLKATLSLALHGDQYTHILLVPPSWAVLIWLAKPCQWRFSAGNRRVGVLLLLTAVAIAAIARWGGARIQADEQISVGMIALVTWWIGSFVLCVGVHASRELRFPLLFLFWLVPFPLFLLTRIENLLQQGSAFAAALLFHVAGVQVIRDSILLSIPGLDLEVATECSSIRSSLILLVSTVLLAHLLLQTRWRKAFVVLLALPLSLAKNGLRIFTIGILGTRVDQSFLTGRLHRDGGVLFFLFALFVILLVLWFLQSREGVMASLPEASLVRS